jgi:D-glycero-alpha-D-manno-heptose-7-phosphate kinase
MIISKTPYRISFFGGGSDYPSWYHRYGGQVLSASIDKYLYISCRLLPPFFKHRFRIVYSIIEQKKNIDQINHRVVKEGLKCFLKNKLIKKNIGLEIHYDGDLPAKSGMGSSSSFVVGFLNVLNSFFSKDINKRNLAKESIFFEQNILKETVGSQDQVAASYGGFNLITFEKKNIFKVQPVITNQNILNNFSNNLLLVFTGINRLANDITINYAKNLVNKNKKNIFEIISHTKIALKLIKENNYLDFGKLLNDTWKIKKSVSKFISNKKIDDIYDFALQNGAVGGKLLGAGAGGFFLFYVPRDKMKYFLKKFSHFITIPFKFESDGSKIIFKSNN